MVDLGIRPYTLSDRMSLLETINSVCAEGRWMETQRYEPTPAWEHALATPDCTCHLLLVVDDGSRIVGWCRVFPGNVSNLEAGLGIGLLPEYRSRGIGTILVQKSIDWARECGLHQIRLRVRYDNVYALRLFAKVGFVSVSQSENVWLEMVLMLENEILLLVV
ncbi:MAG: GNAT family N-acetyltransferase [Anaerolineae bacterium]|nr:GNAT family N-acetyltransferase [Anaerolineae bacterium]